MPHVYRINNKPYTIFSEKDIYYIIDENCSSEISDMIREIIDDLKGKADYTSQKIGTDLDSYEAQLESYNNAFCDVTENLDKLDNYISDSKRLDRNEILSVIGDVRKQISNVW